MEGSGGKAMVSRWSKLRGMNKIRYLDLKKKELLEQKWGLTLL